MRIRGAVLEETHGILAYLAMRQRLAVQLQRRREVVFRMRAFELMTSGVAPRVVLHLDGDRA